MRIPLRILMVEDDPGDAKLAEHELQRGGFDVQSRLVCTAADFSDALNTTLWDLILCDHNMPTFDSVAALHITKALQPDVPFIIISGSLPEAAAAQAMLLGAQDYLSKDNLARLVSAVQRELRDAAERRARRQAEQALSAQAEELRIGREIQQRLFPAAAPMVAGFDIAGASWPAAATGGDYFDYIPMKEQCLGIVVGDVAGHGLGPALIMAASDHLEGAAQGAIIWARVVGRGSYKLGPALKAFATAAVLRGYLHHRDHHSGCARESHCRRAGKPATLPRSCHAVEGGDQASVLRLSRGYKGARGARLIHAVFCESAVSRGLRGDNFSCQPWGAEAMIVHVRFKIDSVFWP